jgi:mitochondrial fission protein ELM1
MLRILIPSDGKPGHYKKAAAIAQALAAEQPADVSFLDVRLRLALFHDVLRRHLRRHRRLPGPRWLSLFYRLPAALPPRPDLIISSGGKTTFVNAWLAQHYGCPNVFIGGTRGVHDAYFSRIVVHDAAYDGDPRFIPSLIPTEITSELLRRAAADYVALRDDAFRARRHWTLLIGGDSGGYRFRQPDWESLGVAIRVLAERHSIRWLMTTSRRTGRGAEEVLRRADLAPHIDELQIFRTDPRRIYNALLGCAESIFCTEDSGTMLTEAAAAGKPLFSIRPRTAEATPALRDLLQFYESRGRLKRVAIDDLQHLRADDVTQGFRVEHEDGLSAVCARILETLPAAA